jgi:hypothetical protein
MRIVDGRSDFYQWDCNQRITSNKFKDGGKVHFSNIKQKEAVTVVAYVEHNQFVADVPNILLMDSLPITAYVYVDDHTVYEQVFKVKQRPKPSDYVYTETEIYTIETAVHKALEDAKASGEFNGENGEDGKNGVDGKDGEKGEPGENGADGYTPQRGVDYWTDADKAEIKSYVDDAILGGAW